jgi:beta-lactamase class A
MLMICRRGVVLGAASCLMTPVGARAVDAPGADTVRAANSRLAALEARHGGRLGVLVRDTGSGREIAYRADERFALCSTFKFLLATAVLERVDRGKEQLDRRISFSESDLDSYAPVTKEHVAEGSMTLADLCAAAVMWSDNTAANLLLRALGGPQALTDYARALGDQITRLDRTEPTLNTAIPGDERDTTSAQAMVRDMNAILLGDALSAPSRLRIEGWMFEAKTGAKRIRAGLPPDWRIGDKTGSGDNATANTIALLRAPAGAPILAAVYYTQSRASADERNAVHADIGRIIAETL